MAYGAVIKKLRESRNMTLRDLHKVVGIDYGHLSRLENESSNKGKEALSPRIDTLLQICNGLNYSFRQFLEESELIEAAPAPTKFSPAIEAIIDLCKQMSESQLHNLTVYGKSLLGIDIGIDYNVS